MRTDRPVDSAAGVFLAVTAGLRMIRMEVVNGVAVEGVTTIGLATRDSLPVTESGWGDG